MNLQASSECYRVIFLIYFPTLCRTLMRPSTVPLTSAMYSLSRARSLSFSLSLSLARSLSLSLSLSLAGLSRSRLLCTANRIQCSTMSYDMIWRQICFKSLDSEGAAETSYFLTTASSCITTALLLPATALLLLYYC